MTSNLRKIAEQLMQSGGYENTLDYSANTLMQLMSCALHGEEINHFENITDLLMQVYNFVSTSLVESKLGKCGLCYINNAGCPQFPKSKESLLSFLKYNSSYKKHHRCSTLAKERYKEEFTSTSCTKRNITILVMMNLTNLVYKISLGFLNPTIRGMKGYLQTKGTNVK